MRSPEVDPTELLAIVESFAKSGADVVVIGGVAIFMQGGDHLTSDVDFVYRREEASLQKIVELLAPHNPRPMHFPASKPFDWSIEILQKINVLTLKCALGRIDLLFQPAGIESYEQLADRADVMDIEGRPIRVACIDDLIAMKKAAGRRKDEAAVFELETIKRLRAELEM